MNNTKHSSTNLIVRSQHTGLFDALLWINQAVDPEAHRPFCQYVHARRTEDGLYVLGTDGARLHTAYFENAQQTYPLEEGHYRVHKRNPNSLNLLRAVNPGVKVPPNILDLLQFNKDKAAKIAWRRNDSENLHPGDLYQLIVALGIEEDDKGHQYGFNPDYLTDVVLEAYSQVYHLAPYTLHAITPAEGIHPRYHAVLMGINL